MDNFLRFQPLGVDLFCLGKKFLVFNLVSRNLKVKYRRSVLGLFWTLLSPLATTAIFYFVFKVVLNVHVPHYLAFILSGVLPWSFFNQTILEGMESIVASLGLISKVPVPFHVFPWVGSVTNLVTLALAIPILIGTSILNGVPLSLSILVLPVFLLALFLMAYGFSMTLAILFVVFRDLRHLMSIAMQLWFYATPIVYQESMIPEKYHWILMFNPVGMVFVSIHKILVDGAWPTWGEFGIVSIWTFLALTLAILTHRTFARDLVERI